MTIYEIKPNDVLFFRDARPMVAGEGSGGHGANWPLPSLFFDAIHAALYRAYPEVTEEWEHLHLHREGKSSRRDMNAKRTKRFGSLSTAGPFPVFNGEWLFPTPADIAQGNADKPTIEPLTDKGDGRSDLPASLLYPLVSNQLPSKNKPAPWRKKREMESYLNGNSAGDGVDARSLFEGEWTTGIRIDPETRAQDGKSIYSAEYLRLAENVCMGAIAHMPLKKLNDADGMDKLFAEERVLVMGGQQRMCRVHIAGNQDPSSCLPASSAITDNRVKWVLLSPAIFPRIEKNDKFNAHHGGWLPNWIDPESGRVFLKKGDTERLPGESRNDWRQRVRSMPDFESRLVAAATPRPVAISGWDLQHNRAKPTHLTVPAGAVYYFEGPDAAQLADALNWHGKDPNAGVIKNHRSTLWGEKGFGLGVCGPW